MLLGCALVAGLFAWYGLIRRGIARGGVDLARRYAEAVQRGGYRGAKIRTALDTVPDVGAWRQRQAGPAGIDGEALVLASPLKFRIRPGVLRVHIARNHPGASPSATAPDGIRAGIVELARIAWGHQNKPARSTTERSE